MSEEVRKFTRFESNRSIPDEVKAAISKLGADPHNPARAQKNMPLPDSRIMAHIANTTIGNTRDARNLFQILPDMDYARQIVISATISPGDLTSSQILYTVNDSTMDTSLTGPLLRKVQDFFDNSYRIRSLLHPILNDVMFETGSYPILTLPESSIDRIINYDNYGGVSMEAVNNEIECHVREQMDANGMYRPWGILGNPTATKDKVDSVTGVSFESLSFGIGSGNAEYIHELKVSDFKISLESYIAPGEENRKYADGLKEVNTSINKLVADKGDSVIVTDNLSILRRPMVVDTKRKVAVSRIYGNKFRPRASFESRASGPDAEGARDLRTVERAMYQKRRYQHIPVQPLLTHKQTGQKTYGHPLVMHLSSESVIPVHVPGNPAEHVGYYVILDIDGNPISIAAQNNYYDDIRGQMNNTDSYASQLITQARRGFVGADGSLQNEIIDEMGKVYSDTVERDLLSRLRSGALTGNYELGKTENISRIMLPRHLKGQKTVMLFVPAEMMTYIAFDYNEFGVGKSILEDGKILGSIRAGIMLANTLATLNNAVGGKTIEIELDPEDEDPVDTVEFMLSEHAKVNSQGFSRIIGSTHPLGLADQIQNHGVNVVVSGNTRYPETKMNVSSREGQNKPIDSDFEETMRKRHIQMFGLSPEIMEGINQTDFATTVVQNNLMLLKRVIQNQEKLEPFLTSFVRGYMLTSGIFLEEIRDLIKDNKDNLPDHIANDPELVDDEAKIDAFMYEFFDALHVGLPSPEVGDIKKQMESFSDYSDALDKCIDAYMTEEMWSTDTSIGMEEMLPQIKAVVKAEYQRRWLRKSNVMPELDVFNTVTEEEGSPAFNLLESVSEHLDGLNNSISGYIKAVVKAAKRRAKVLGKIAEDKAALEEAKQPADGTDGMGGDDLGGTDGADGMDGLDAGDGGDLGDGTDTAMDGGDGLDMGGDDAALDAGDAGDTGTEGAEGTDGIDAASTETGDAGDGAEGVDAAAMSMADDATDVDAAAGTDDTEVDDTLGSEEDAAGADDASLDIPATDGEPVDDLTGTDDTGTDDAALDIPAADDTELDVPDTSSETPGEGLDTEADTEVDGAASTDEELPDTTLAGNGLDVTDLPEDGTVPGEEGTDETTEGTDAGETEDDLTGTQDETTDAEEPIETDGEGTDELGETAAAATAASEMENEMEDDSTTSTETPAEEGETEGTDTSDEPVEEEDTPLTPEQQRIKDAQERNEKRANAAVKSMKIPDESSMLDMLPDNKPPKV